MADEKIPGIIRDFLKALEAKDGDKVLSFFAEDGDWTIPEGVFKGKEELKHYLNWMLPLFQGGKITECGNGIITQGNKAYVEFMVTGTVMGKKVEYLEMAAWEFSDDKIKHVRRVSDRLLICKQAARGWLQKWVVNYIVKQVEKGLH